MSRNYTVPIQDAASVGDIIIVGVYGVSAVGATPSGWTLIASIGTLCALYSHTVATGEPGTSVDFVLGSNNKVACFVLAISGATGVTGRLSPSAGAVGSQAFTVSSSAAALIVAGCFSTLTQKFTSPFAVSAPALGSAWGLQPSNSPGIGTNCPSVVYGPTTASSVLTFGASRSTALMSFELDVTGITPQVYADFATTEGDIPASSPAFTQQTTGHGTTTTLSMPALTINQNDCLVITSTFYNNTAGITETITDNNSGSGSWVEVTGEPNHEATSSFLIHADLWYFVGHPSGSTTVTSTVSATPTNIWMNLSVYSGVATANPVDTQTSGISSVAGTNAQTGTINTSNAGDLLVGCASTDLGSAVTITDYGSAGGTPTALTPPAGGLLWPAYQIVSATGNYGFKFAFASSCDWAAAIVALKAANLIFFSGWETGDSSEWRFSGGTFSVQTTTVHPGGGNYALQAGVLSGTLGSNYNQNGNAVGSLSPLYSRVYVLLHGLSASIAIRQFVVHCFQQGVGTDIGEVCVTTDASGNPSIQLYNEIAGATVGSAYPVRLDTWYLIELKQIVSATVGVLELKINGAIVATGSGLNTGTSTTLAPFVGAVNAVGTGTPLGQAFFDDYALSLTGYIGGGVCLARQFTSTTPNYNTFTKSNASTINTVWDDTPFATATNATDAVSAGKQTGVVDFSTTNGAASSGSQHSGPGLIHANDVINAAKIGAVAKTGTASDAADSTIFRTPAGGSGVDTVTLFGISMASLIAGWATADGYNDTVLTTPPTASQILNCEAGIQHNATTNTHTYEDVWLMVDVTFGQVPPLVRHRHPPKRPPLPVHHAHARPYIFARPIGMPLTALQHHHPPSRVTIKKPAAKPRRHMPLSQSGISFVGRTQAFSGSGTPVNIVLSTPAGIAAGDLMLVLYVSGEGGASGGTFNLPSGWTQLGANIGPDGDNNIGHFCYRFYQVSDGTSYTFGNNIFPKAIMRAYRGVARLDANQLGHTSAAATSFTISALSATQVASEWYVAFWFDDGPTTTLTNTTGDLIHVTTDNSDYRTLDGDKVIVAQGSTPGTEASSGPSGQWDAAAVTLIPGILGALVRTPRRIRPKLLPLHVPRVHIHPFLFVSPVTIPSRLFLHRQIRPKLSKPWKAVKSNFKKVWLIQPPVAKLGFAVTRVARRHPLKNNPLAKFIKHPLVRPRGLIQPPTSALGLALREVVRKAHPLKLGKPWKAIKSSFNRAPLLGPALLAFATAKLKRPHRLTLRRPSALIKSSFKKFWLIQPPVSALGIALREVVRKAHPVKLGKAWKTVKSSFKRPLLAGPAVLLPFVPSRLHRARRLVLRRASSLIKSSFKKVWLIQPPAAKLGFPPPKLAKRHLLILQKPARLIKSAFKRPLWLIQPPAAKLGFPPTRLAVRHRLLLRAAQKLIKSTFRAPRKLIQPRVAAFPPTRLAKRHPIRLLKQANLIKSTFKRPLWLIQPPAAKLGFPPTKLAKRHLVRLLKPFNLVKSKFKRPTWLIQPPAAKLGFPPTKLAKRHLVRLLKPARLVKSSFKRPLWLIQPPAAKLGMAMRLLFHRQRLVRFARPFQSVKSLFKRPEREIQPILPGFIRIIHAVRRARLAARRRPLRTTIHTFTQPIAARFRHFRRVVQARPRLVHLRLRALFTAPGGFHLVRRARQLARSQPRRARSRLRALVVPAVLRLARHLRRLMRAQPRQISPRRRAIFSAVFVTRGRIRRLVRRISPLARRSRRQLPISPKPIIAVWIRARPSRVKHQVIVWIRRWFRLRRFPRPIISRDAPRVIIYAILDAAVIFDEATLTPVPAIVVSAGLDRVVVIDEAFLGEV